MVEIDNYIRDSGISSSNKKSYIPSKNVGGYLENPGEVAPKLNPWFVTGFADG